LGNVADLQSHEIGGRKCCAARQFSGGADDRENLCATLQQEHATQSPHDHEQKTEQ
jgi:hypothetical protein